MPRPTKHSEVRAAREMRAAGVPYRLIEIRLNRTKSWIQDHAMDVPGAVRRGVEPDAETRDAAVRMYRNGVRQEEVADRLEVRLYWVRKWCHGLRPYPDKTRAGRAMQMVRDGMSNKQIARALGYKSGDTVASIVSRERRRQREEMSR